MLQRLLNWRQPLGRITHLQLSPPLVLALGFLGVILLGTLALKLPWATHHGHSISWFEAFFTATSAVTVTGLTVIEPANTLSIWGQVLLTLLVQIGGLGFVTFTVLVIASLGKRISVQQQVLALESFHQISVAHIKQTAIAVISIAFSIQTITVIWLSLWWWLRLDIDYSSAAYQAYFHVVMAFNNAGIALYDHSLLGLQHEPISLITLSTMITLGGLGFPVLMDVLKKRRWARLSAYSKIILLGTLCLNGVGFLTLWALEHNNPDTIGHLSLIEQASASWLQAISSRTSGFVSMAPQYMHDSSLLLIMLYMFIGGGSMSTASGIKVGTFIVLLAAVYSYFKQRHEVVLMHRTVPAETVQKALSLVVVTFGLFFFGLLAISIFDNINFKSLMFEVTAAISTTGMSFGITSSLSTPSQCIIIVLMFAGRIGPLTLVYSLATRRRSRIRYPEAHFPIG